MREAGQVVRAHRVVGWAAGAVVVAVLAALAPALLGDPDVWWHVAIGDRVLSGGGLPTVDTWSWTRAGSPWIAKEWLAQLVMAAAARIGGWTGVALLAVLATATALGVVAAHVREHVTTSATVVLVAAAFVLAAPHLLARPHVLALPLLAVWTSQLLRTDGRRPRWTLLALLVVWANLHGSYLLGIGIAGAVALEHVVETREARTALVRSWGGFLAACAAVTLVTPYGPGTLLAALDVLGLGAARDVIVEWQAPQLGPVHVVVGLAAAALVRLRARLSWPRLLLLLGLVALALTARRNGDVLGVVAPLLLAQPLGEALAARGHAPEPTLGSARVAVVACAAAGIVLVTVPAVRPLAPATRHAPAAAVDALVATGSERVLNDYSFGGYLLARGVPTFVDGRTELFGGPLVEAHDAALRLDPPAALDALVAVHDPDAALLQPGTPALDVLEADPRWRRVHADEHAVVLVRVD